MDEELTQVLTQHQFDPRRLGRNNSGLNEDDVSNVICILHPSSLAAFRIVNHTARNNPQHVLQNGGLTDFEDSGMFPTSGSEAMLGDQSLGEQALDLALRFSSNVVDPSKGFCFGRNSMRSDINLDADDMQKRISGTHFRIFFNHVGVLMLEDLSTNGTIVDENILGGKKRQGNHFVSKGYPQRMLSSGSVIEILLENHEDRIKFILRIPSRDGHLEAFTNKYQAYMSHRAIAEDRAAAAEKGPPMPDAAARGILAAPFGGPPNPKAIPNMHPPNISNDYGMQWSGGQTFKCTGVLGKGAFATVYQLATRMDGELFAAKELEKKRFMKNGILDTRLDNEMQIMKGLVHPNIVQYVDYIETANHLYIIMEYVQCGDMAGYMQAHGTLPEPLAKTMTKQILHALGYLHEKNITHRDIKPDNILICTEEPFVVKLTDFGLSKVVKNNETFLKTFCGTLLYCAPEVFPQYDTYLAGKRPKRRRQSSSVPNGRRSYSQLVDIWSYAAVLWFVLCGKPPFEGVLEGNGKGMFNKIMDTPLDTSPLQEYGISNECIDLLLRMLDVDPATRPDEIACLKHPWLSEGATMPDEELTGLASIPEDEEELDASQLSIHDDESGNNDSQESAGSNNPRVAKRVKGESFFDLRPEGNPSLDYQESYESIPIVNDVHWRRVQVQPGQGPKLFGEISQQRAFRSSGLLGMADTLDDSGVADGQHSVIDSDMSAQSADGDQRQNHDQVVKHSRRLYKFASRPAPGFHPPPLPASGSWRESMVRELNMTSPTSSHGSQDAGRDPMTPQERPQATTSSSPTQLIANVAQADADVTPKAAPRPAFDRRMNIPLSAAYYYDPNDPSTHNVAYASKVSGMDFNEDGSISENGVHSVPQTEFASLNSSGRSETGTHAITQGPDKENALGLWEAGPGGSLPTNLTPQTKPITIPTTASVNFTSANEAILNGTATDFLKPTPILGHLTSTASSFMSITLPLTQRITTWGRSPGCTYVYRNGHDTRISKVGLEVWFLAPGIEQLLREKSADWTQMKELEAVVATRAKAGVWVNGVRLTERDESGRRCYGRVFEGDEIVVVRPDAQGKGGLSFVCDFAVGRGKRKRKEAGFEVEFLDEAKTAAAAAGGSSAMETDGARMH